MNVLTFSNTVIVLNMFVGYLMLVSFKFLFVILPTLNVLPSDIAFMILKQFLSWSLLLLFIIQYE